MKPLQLHHASIRVKDLARSDPFYRDLLRLTPIARPDLGVRGTWYGIGSGQLHLIEAEPFGARIDPSGPHFAIEVENLDEARRCLAERHIETLDPGGNQLWLLDPDGYTVELTQISRAPAAGSK